MSDKNLEIFRQTNKGYPCEVLRNWASITPVSASDDYHSLRQKYDLNDKVIFFSMAVILGMLRIWRT